MLESARGGAGDGVASPIEPTSSNIHSILRRAQLFPNGPGHLDHRYSAESSGEVMQHVSRRSRLAQAIARHAPGPASRRARPGRVVRPWCVVNVRVPSRGRVWQGCSSRRWRSGRRGRRRRDGGSGGALRSRPRVGISAPEPLSRPLSSTPSSSSNYTRGYRKPGSCEMRCRRMGLSVAIVNVFVCQLI